MFETTRWSLVLAAGSDEAGARMALEELCRIYRPAVLAWLRGRGHPRSEAEDLTQGFFVRFIEKRMHESAIPDRGRFRTYLRAALHHFVINAAEYAQAARRHAGQPASAVDPETLAAAETDAPDRAFERAWALALVQRAMQRLRREAIEAGKAELFERLQDCLVEAPDSQDYARIAAAFGARPNTIAVAAHRLRKRLHGLVQEEIALTVADQSEIDAEYATIANSLRETRGPVR
jgi:RNA polymerase sigma-70 factor (ECF subfamily)